jgi:flavin reductase (DIM6/NTAB) family NADH-FMN oxidoreductase RutF
MKLDPQEQPESVYRTLSSLVVPRPIGWISTVSADGTDNLAPFSYFNAVGNRPPTVMFSAGDRDGRLKDTPQNALDTEEFVTNIVTENLVPAMDETSESVNASEFDTSDIERTPAETVTPPRVASALAHLECEVSDSIQVGGNTVVFGEVKFIHVDDQLVTDNAVDAREIDAVGRFGGPFYTRTDLMEYTRQY